MTNTETADLPEDVLLCSCCGEPTYEWQLNSDDECLHCTGAA